MCSDKHITAPHGVFHTDPVAHSMCDRSPRDCHFKLPEVKGGSPLLILKQRCAK